MKCAIVLAALVVVVLSQSAEQKLKNCCSQLKGADQECVGKFCSFHAISQANILAFLGKCTERGPTVGYMWDCASSRKDHTECCEKAGVTGKCLEYCSAHDGVPTNYLDYLFCVESFNEIRQCFEEHLEKNDAFVPKEQ